MKYISGASYINNNGDTVVLKKSDAGYWSDSAGFGHTDDVARYNAYSLHRNHPWALVKRASIWQEKRDDNT